MMLFHWTVPCKVMLGLARIPSPVLSMDSSTFSDITLNW